MTVNSPVSRLSLRRILADGSTRLMTEARVSSYSINLRIAISELISQKSENRSQTSDLRLYSELASYHA